MAKFGVVIFPGSNCDHDVINALETGLKQTVIRLWHKSTDLQQCDCIILPGGFSFGDYLRSGGLAKFSPIMTEVKSFALGGGFVLGICNGFQILCEAGMLPGALLMNTSRKFICRNTFLSVQNRSTAITQDMPKGRPISIPIAHGEGRYHTDSDSLQRMNKNSQVLFRYCNSQGEITEAANPNGSLENIAGICNETRNVFGMMPHPERAADELLGNTDGNYILNSLIHALSEKEAVAK